MTDADEAAAEVRAIVEVALALWQHKIDGARTLEELWRIGEGLGRHNLTHSEMPVLETDLQTTVLAALAPKGSV
jgi:hypothetical protein